MGLDFMDLGYRIEKEFKVFLTNEDYESIQTVGDLEEVIARRMTNVWPCPHIPAFSNLCAGLAELGGCSEDEIQLDTNLDQLVRPKERVNFWKHLEETTGLKLPALQIPQFVHRIECSLFFTPPVMAVLYIFSTRSNVEGFIILLIPMSIVLSVLLLNAFNYLYRTFFLRFEFPIPELPTKTLRDLTRAVASMNREDLVTPISTHYQPIWPRLVNLIEDAGGVDEDEVIPSARFVEDLGFG